jgi:hypothetical protein
MRTAHKPAMQDLKYAAAASLVHALKQQTVSLTQKRVLSAVHAAAACSPPAAQQQLD